MSEALKTTRVTAAAIARAAGVSRPAVYAVLNGTKPKTIGVSEATRQKIQAAIRQLGYIPNHAARALVSGRSHTVGLLLTNPTAVFDRKLVETFGTLFGNAGYTVITNYHCSDPEIERKRLMEFYSRNFDMVVINFADLRHNYDLLEKMAEGGTKVIILSTTPDHPDFHFVSFDEPALMEQVVAHLRRAELFRVAYLTTSTPLGNSPREAFLKAALAPYPAMRLVHQDAVGNYQELQNVVAHYLSMAEPPEAILCYHDRLALPLLHILCRQQIPVPEQFSVIGIDDDDDPFSPLPLTSVRLPLQKLVAACLDYLLQPDPRQFAGQLRLISGIELIERATTRPPVRPEACSNAQHESQ